MAKDIIKIPEIKLFKVRKVKIGNTFMNVAIAGKGKPVIMVHGWTNNWMGFSPVGKYLKKECKTVLVDLMGYGDSGRLEKYSLEIQAKYLKRMIDKLGLKDYCLVGHSMGTFVVSKFYQMYPKEVRKIVLIGAVFKSGRKKRLMKISERFYRLISKRERMMRLVKRIVDHDLYSYVTSKYINMYKYDEEIIQKYGTIGKIKLTKEAYTQMGAEVSGTNVEEMIANNKIPLLLVYGKYDKITNMPQAETVLRDRGNYQWKEIDKSGHIVTVERPKEVAETIIEFVR
jgi:pimeloyl-ACP methyl ester carboxylesterase